MIELFENGGIEVQNNVKARAYGGLTFAVFIWGISPLLTLRLYRYYSPAFRLFLAQLVLLPAYLLISGRHLREINASYIRVGMITGLFLALADICQKIGLAYTTPSRYAFFENLSCITVPAVSYFITKKKPRRSAVAAAVICLCGVLVLNGISFRGSAWGMGELLCAAAGLFYGVNIAVTGAYAKKIFAPLYLAVQVAVEIAASGITVLVLNAWEIADKNGTLVPAEKIMYSLNPRHLLFLASVTLVSSALCWTVRTNSMKHVEASAVAVIMPFSAVITSTASVICGTERLTVRLVLGGLICLGAIFMSSLGDIKGKAQDCGADSPQC